MVAQRRKRKAPAAVLGDADVREGTVVTVDAAKCKGLHSKPDGPWPVENAQHVDGEFLVSIRGDETDEADEANPATPTSSGPVSSRTLSSHPLSFGLASRQSGGGSPNPGPVSPLPSSRPSTHSSASAGQRSVL